MYCFRSSISIERDSGVTGRVVEATIEVATSLGERVAVGCFMVWNHQPIAKRSARLGANIRPKTRCVTHRHEVRDVILRITIAVHTDDAPLTDIVGSCTTRFNDNRGIQD